MDKTILLVEDNPDTKAIILRAFRKIAPNIKMVIACNGAEALELIFRTDDNEGSKSTGPHLVLLDLKLPKVSGLNVLRQIRADAKTKTLPVIIFTPSIDEEDILDSYTHGANSYIRKPIDFAQWCDILKHVVSYWLFLSQLPPPQQVR
jgi:two-component system, response regulator